VTAPETEPSDPFGPLGPQPNPYTDDAPLRVHDHPWRENRVIVLIAALVAAAPLVWLLVRVLGGAEPVVHDELLLALLIGEPLALVIALFPVLVSSGAHLTLGATTLTRKLRAGRGTTKTVRLADIRAGIYASKVRYRREYGKELVLFLAGGEILWIADGLEPEDVAKVAAALSTYNVRAYGEPITNQQLAALVRKARRAGSGERG
jgi:hypothetical protein